MSFSIINQNKTICFNRSVENFEDFLNFEVLQNNTKSTFVIKIHTTMYNGKARNAIIQYELKLDYEGNYDGKEDAANELVIDEDEVFDKKALGLIDDGGDDAFLDFVNFDDSDYEYEYENEEEVAIQLPKTIRN